MPTYQLKDGRVVGGNQIIDFDATHTNNVISLTSDEYTEFVTSEIPDPPPPPPLPPSVLSQDLMAQFTPDDAAKIETAIAGNTSFWLLWSAMQAQKDPMVVTNTRFLQGWNALIQVLGVDRMSAIATALNVKIG